MSSALNGSSVLQRFERGNTVEIRNGIMFDFYPRDCHIMFDFYPRDCHIMFDFYPRDCHI